MIFVNSEWEGKEVRIIKGFENPLGTWKNGSIVTVKQDFGEYVTVHEFLGSLYKTEMERI